MRLPYRKPGKFSTLAKDPLMTKEKCQALSQELHVLKEIQHPKAASEVRRLGELGDFSENAEYQLAKGRLRRINYKILELEHELKQANIIAKPTQTQVVALGHTVTLEDDSQHIHTYTILGSSETNPKQGIISQHSPIGKAILGKKKGDTVTISLPKGNITYAIRAIT